MSQNHITERLDAYVDDRLDPLERAEVDSHLAECQSCSRELAAYDPVDLDDLRLVEDEDGLRRTVRRALGRTAIDAAALTVIVLVVGVLASLFVVQPLLINRSDRAAVAARAAYETPMLFNPGVVVSRLNVASGLFGRTATVSAGIPLGSSEYSLGNISSEIGLLSIRSGRVPSVWSEVPLGDVLPGLGDGTVVSVVFETPRPMSLADAQVLADNPGSDVRLTWVGFDVASSALGQVGYPLCHALVAPPQSLLGASSVSYGGPGISGLPSVQRAIDSARAALTVIASNDEVAAAVSRAGAGAVTSLADSLDGERSVVSLVVTGPTPEVVSFLSDLGVDNGSVLAVGFYSWGSPVCGR
jgi:hypothetical protein